MLPIKRQLRSLPLKNYVIRALSTSRPSLHFPIDKKTSTSQDEMDHFNQLASTWWDVDGPQRILHKMNLLRMDFIQETLRNSIDLNQDVESPDEEIYIPGYNIDLLPKPIAEQIIAEQELKREELVKSQPKLKALDIGCGGGILSESLARLKQIESVKGVDLSTDVLEAAKLHQRLDPSLHDKLQYRLSAVEDISKDEQFDIITMFEMLEHVNYPNEVLKSALGHIKPGGWLFISTINRDFISWFTTIFMGEHVLKIVPVGTHHLDKYINETELQDWFKEQKDFKVANSKGCIYLPFNGWSFTDSPNVGNFFMAIQRTK
ncbi:Hexaprenyldihydroxybenzoate methyltransferase,mitochondrial [Wickerhamomyces ciferrii]|uniref:Ubiquinone biosynthesis O-methyltransferase, mitochondrial n=1 Tax=Wickerhamomyces ciferrii (strain ATCC 14091 / BCRC 22168 / CBS 111 / JCM 3599 / NBRC 0793 / NRRL Y-1031 F-60-10) TaxID=1206466 RepID=K0KNT8_WICCF|nr:Hexaprenyldihydroxybenzoate methyltransferase,mitochondrial [Wickerhamomyces ciferrii]CCH42758.1 Hexaprenyldihydroxybenzoate methyltransferase,mitochondrial [Wickerhamomyces ciferrii]